MQIRGKRINTLFLSPGSVPLITLGLFFFLNVSIDQVVIRYTDTSTIPFDWNQEFGDTLILIDTVTSETVFQVSSKKGYPVYYYKEISTNVCFDGQCRPIQMNVYWNITGRYLGFLLENSEYLSKRDHVAFDSTDYNRLHSLLADPYIPFANTSFEELVGQPIETIGQVDAISGATNKALSSFVVEGAAYTSFVLWNIIYGSSQMQVQNATKHELNAELLVRILESPSVNDKLWGLRRIGSLAELDLDVEKSLLSIISSADYFTAITAINTISSIHLHSHSLQDGLFEIYQKGKSNLENQIIDKLNESPEISQTVLLRSRSILKNLNGNQLDRWLDLYDQNGIRDVEICKNVTLLLEDSNRFIANKAYKFLIKMNIDDELIRDALRTYENRMK